MFDSVCRKNKVLVVENEAVVSNICRIALEAEGFNVNTVPDCLTAQKIISETDFDLCLIDLAMPEISGMQLYQWLQQARPALAEKAVFSTGLILEGNVRDFLQKSGRLTLLKPFSLDELISIMKEASRR